MRRQQNVDAANADHAVRRAERDEIQAKVLIDISYFY